MASITLGRGGLNIEHKEGLRNPVGKAYEVVAACFKRVSVAEERIRLTVDQMSLAASYIAKVELDERTRLMMASGVQRPLAEVVSQSVTTHPEVTSKNTSTSSTEYLNSGKSLSNIDQKQPQPPVGEETNSDSKYGQDDRAAEAREKLKELHSKTD